MAIRAGNVDVNYLVDIYTNEETGDENEMGEAKALGFRGNPIWMWGFRLDWPG